MVHQQFFELYTRHGYPVPLYGMRIALCCRCASAAVLDWRACCQAPSYNAAATDAALHACHLPYAVPSLMHLQASHDFSASAELRVHDIAEMIAGTVHEHTLLHSSMPAHHAAGS